MKIWILNGPNLNLLGTREREIYGNEPFEHYLDRLRGKYPTVDLAYYQSNVEGELINQIHKVGFSSDGIILNAGAYTHTSIAIADAIAAVTTPVVEVHISNIYERESYRRHSFVAEAAVASVVGKGLQGYADAVSIIADRYK